MNVVWTEQALQDLDCAYDYIAEDSPSAAVEVVRSIFEMTQHLSCHSELGRSGRIPNTRELIVSNSPYIVLYEIYNERVQILGVLHTRRRWMKSL